MAISEKYGQINIPGIPKDEPVFIVRAQDQLGGDTVSMYAMLWALRIKEATYAQAVASPFHRSLMGVAEKLRGWPVKKMPHV